MKQRRRAKACALGMAVLLCVSNLTTGTGAVSRSESEVVCAEEAWTDTAEVLAGEEAADSASVTADLPADPCAESTVTAPSSDAEVLAGPVDETGTGNAAGEEASSSGEAAQNQTELIADPVNNDVPQTEAVVLAGPVELNDTPAGNQTENTGENAQETALPVQSGDQTQKESENGSGTESGLISEDSVQSEAGTLSEEGSPSAVSSPSETDTDSASSSYAETGSTMGTEGTCEKSAGSEAVSDQKAGTSTESYHTGTEAQSAAQIADALVSDSEKESNPSSEKSPDEEEIYLYENSMTLEELAHLPEDEAGAATEVTAMRMASSAPGMLRAASESSDLWTCSNYYINEEDLYSVQENSDFSLKYQVEFHTSTALDPGCVVIRVPEAFMNDRRGGAVVPSQIGVPGGTIDNPKESLNSPFNWYKDTNTGELVFFNYRSISSGTNSAFQVLYHPVRILDLCDNTSWAFTPSVTVTRAGAAPEERLLEELTGIIDSHAQILSISANAYSDGSISCMPALYTKDQVKRVLGGSPPSFVSDDGNWLFIAWQIDCLGDYNQPFRLRLDGNLSASSITGSGDLCVVGSVTSVTGTAEGDAGNGSVVSRYIPSEKGTCLAELSSDDLSQYVRQGQFHLTTIAVTAIRKDALSDQTSVITLDPAVSLTPADGIDPVSTADTKASWTFVDYTWEYQGDIVGIGAWTGERYQDDSVAYNFHEKEFPGWINEYRLLNGDNASSGPIPFRIRSECRGYAYTHETEGTMAGSYKTGTGYEVTTADDVVYAICQSADGNVQSIRVLSGEDYYYSRVSVCITDRGMDIFEDLTTSPMSEEECPGADRSTIIYAMYEGSSSWEQCAECPWDDSGRITYEFSKEQLSRKPWRIKAVHNAADYDSTCVIDSEVCIRPDSPVMAELLSSSGSDGTAVMKLEHLGSVLARSTGTEQDSWFHDRSDSGAENYSEPGLRDLTRSLYGEISMRANSYAALTELKKHARALKTLSRENDPAGGCIRLDYIVGAIEGYLVYSKSAAECIAKGETDFPTPNRLEYVIYDLLPEGVIFDPSESVKAGLVMGTQDKHLVTPSLWKKKGVSAYVDSDSGVISNWKNTGRTMLILNISISEDLSGPARMCEGMWMNGIGVQFSAYCPYRDLKQMKNMPNIAAVMPGSGRDLPENQLIGSDDEVACDDGVIIPYSDEVKAEFRDFGADIDSDGITGLRTVLYAYASSQGDAAVSLSDGISLTVKADQDEFLTEGKSAVVGAGDPYTYRIDVTNSSSEPVSQLVIADHIEIASEERAEAENGRQFDEEVWTGYLTGVDTEAVKRLGIAPVVYLNADRHAPLPGEGNSPDQILTPENGWILATDWSEDMGDALSVAVDLRKKEDGSDFILNQGDSVHVFLHMQSPEIGDGEGETRAEHAYNCASFYSVSQDEPDADLVTCDAVEVTLKERNTIIVEKEIKGEIPEDRADESYLFRLMRGDAGVPLSVYRLETMTEDSAGNAIWKEDGKLHTTDRDGLFRLSKGQRAVFENDAGKEDLSACEIRSACYESDVVCEDTQEGSVWRFENTWHPTLYLRKKVYGAPKDCDLSEDVFRVKVTAGGKSLAGMPYQTIDQDQGLVDDQVVEEHTVDEESCVMIHADEVIALHPGDAGCAIEVKEEDSVFGPDSDYIAVTGEKSQLLDDDRTEILLENAWKWKDLILRKEILHREEVPEDDVFHFRLWKMHEGEEISSFDPENPGSCADPAAGIECVMRDQSFTTDSEGRFSCALAGKEVVLNHLEAGKGYVIEETDVPEFYEAVNGGVVSVTMPILGDKRYVSITNSWKKRSLEVSKAVLAGEHDRRTTICTPGYPGYIQDADDYAELLDVSPSGMESFTLTFPETVILNDNVSIKIYNESGPVEILTGTIEAGTQKTYTGSLARISLRTAGQKTQEGFFLYFIPSISGASDLGNDMSGKQFSFRLEIEDENGQMNAAADTAYVSSSGEILSTDDNGMFTLCSGTQARFVDLGVEGTAWRVTEIPDPECGQVYPDQNEPWSGKLGDGGMDTSHALFINGEACQGMIRKRFCAAAGDTAAEQIILQERAKGASSRLRSVFLIEKEDENGSYIPLTGEIDVADSLEGKLFTAQIPDGYLVLSENQTAILSGIDPGKGFRVTETESGLLTSQDRICGVECITPGEGRMISGTISESMACADFVNEVHTLEIQPDDLICKEFLSGESGWAKVKEGAVLAFRIERYEDGIWKSAAGVRWVQCLNQMPYEDSFHITGDDGIIRVSKVSDAYSDENGNVHILPIAIQGAKVKTELYYLHNEAQEGDLRVREAADLSDPSYGMTADCEGNTFINENTMKPLIVEKQTDVETDQAFTMQIMQHFTEGDLPGRYLSYKIVDADTGETTGTGQTDDRGLFQIRAGQQAVFELAEGSSWTVTERNCGNWKLISGTMDNKTSDPVQVEGGISFSLLSIIREVTLTKEMLSEDLKDPATGQVIDFTLPAVTIPHYVEKDGKILEICEIGDSVFENSPTLQSVKIEEGIRHLGSSAFSMCSKLTSVELPRSLESIGAMCFLYDPITRLEIWENVSTVGENIVLMCLNLTEIIIHQNEDNDTFSGYAWNTCTNTHVEFSPIS